MADIHTYRFTDSKELIYKSSFYKKFCNKIKQAFFQQNLDDNESIIGYIRDILYSAFTLRNWPSRWTFIQAKKYTKNCEEAVEIYCQMKIGAVYRQLNQENKPVTEKRLERLLLNQDYKNDEFIHDMYLILMICGLTSFADEFRKLYFGQFSWNRDESVSHQHTYKQYENQIQKKDVLIESLRKENEALKEEIQKNQAKTFSGKTRKEKRLEKALKEKEKENEELKKKLEMAEQFAKAAVQKAETDCEVDIEELKQHKYLFCAENEEILHQLSQYLPESIYVSNTTTNFKNVKVDAVVIPTKFISHGMYYKVKNLLNVPLIHCNGNSGKAILCEIQSEVNKKQTA